MLAKRKPHKLRRKWEAKASCSWRVTACSLNQVLLSGGQWDVTLDYKCISSNIKDSLPGDQNLTMKTPMEQFKLLCVHVSISIWFLGLSKRMFLFNSPLDRFLLGSHICSGASFDLSEPGTVTFPFFFLQASWYWITTLVFILSLFPRSWADALPKDTNTKVGWLHLALLACFVSEPRSPRATRLHFPENCQWQHRTNLPGWNACNETDKPH